MIFYMINRFIECLNKIYYIQVSTKSKFQSTIFKYFNNFSSNMNTSTEVSTDVTHKGKNECANLLEIFRDCSGGKQKKTSGNENVFPPEICAKSSQMRNDLVFNVSSSQFYISR